MKKFSKILLPITAITLAVMLIMTGKTNEISVYNLSDEEIKIKPEQLEEYSANGYYTQPVQTVYAPNGKTAVIYADEFNDYSNVGWFSEVPLLIYSPTGRKIYIEPSQLDAYLEKGCYEEPFITLYSADASQEISVKESEVPSYVAQGWATEPPEHEGLSDLFAQLESYVITRNGNWGVFVQNMATNEYLTLHETQYSGASLIKLFTMAAVYNEVAAGSMSFSEKTKDQMRQMITISSNSAFNYLTRCLGGGNTSKGFDVENAHTKSIGCTNTQHNSELVEYDGYKAFYKGRNRTSPRDVGRILTMIYKGKLVSPEASNEMLELLKAQTRRWKIPASLPENIVVANKTGETSTVEADAAIVYSPGADYVICIIGNGNINGGTATIHEISRIVYNYFNS